MDLKSHAQFALGRARELTQMLLPDFKTREDWLFRPSESGNHALWIVAHLGLADNHFAAKFRPDGCVKPEGWDKLFWYDSKLQDDKSVYPGEAEVLAYLAERREHLLEVIKDLSEEELLGPPPEKGPVAGAPNQGHWLLFAAYHEGIHTGQLTAAHRGLGHAPKR